MSELERISAEAQNGVPITVGLERAREALATPLITAKNKLQALCLNAKNLLENISHSRCKDASIEINANILLDDAKAQLNEAVEAIEQASNSKKGFKQLHGLGREPISLSPVLGCFLLIGAMLGETVINSFFFQNAYMVATPTAALVTSGLISLCNISVSTCAGFFIGRRLDYGKNAIESGTTEFKKIRIRAKAFHFLSLFAIAFFHLTVGLVRSQESLTKIEHSIPAYTQFLQTPEAIFLVLTGLCLSLIAWNKGRSSFKDPYLNYSDHQKAVDDAREALVDLRKDFSAQLNDVFQGAVEDENKSRKQHLKAIANCNTAVKACQDAYQKLTKDVHKADEKLSAQTRQIIEIYRSVGKDVDFTFDTKAQREFQDLLVVDLPKQQPPPEISPQSIALNQMQADVVEQLANIFSNTTGSNTGEPK